MKRRKAKSKSKQRRVRKSKPRVPKPAGRALKRKREGPVRPVETRVGLGKSPRRRDLREEAARAASTGKVQGGSPDLDSIVEIQAELEDAVRVAEIHDVSRNPAVPRQAYDGAEIPTISVGITIDTEKASPHPAPAGADRRAHPRYAFSAAIEVLADEQGVPIKAYVRDLSRQGCYVNTSRPLVIGTLTDVCISKGATALKARARVVYSQAGKGMGLMFTAVRSEHLRTLDAWIAQSRESSWHAANRRRSQRVVMQIPVRVSGRSPGGSGFDERTHTLSISAHGALIAVEASVHRGQRIIVSNMRTKATLECIVVYLERIPNEPTQVGVEFMLPNPTFWRVAFPPKDWTTRHPDAKSW